MTLTQLTYLLSTLIFGSLCLLIIWRLGERVLKKNEFVLLVMIIISLPIAATEYFAIKWQAWAYNPSKTLDFRFGTEVDSYVFGIVVVSMIAGFTLVLSNRVDKKLKPKHRRRK